MPWLKYFQSDGLKLKFELYNMSNIHPAAGFYFKAWYNIPFKVSRRNSACILRSKLMLKNVDFETQKIFTNPINIIYVKNLTNSDPILEERFIWLLDNALLVLT